jgi:hypothetical protein
VGSEEDGKARQSVDRVVKNMSESLSRLITENTNAKAAENQKSAEKKKDRVFDKVI